MRAVGGKHRASAHDRGFQCLRAGGCEVGGDDPRRAGGQDVRGELGGVAGHRGDVVTGVQDLAADTAGGGDDREFHGVLQVHRVSWARWG